MVDTRTSIRFLLGVGSRMLIPGLLPLRLETVDKVPDTGEPILLTRLQIVSPFEILDV